MLLEEELSENPLWEDMCAILLYMDFQYDLDTPFEKEKAKDNWDSFVKSLKEEVWKDGKHTGDCTNIGITCNRCVLEEKAKEAKYIISALKDMGHPPF